jgi:hypothetical protein
MAASSSSELQRVADGQGPHEQRGVPTRTLLMTRRFDPSATSAAEADLEAAAKRLIKGWPSVPQTPRREIATPEREEEHAPSAAQIAGLSEITLEECPALQEMIQQMQPGQINGAIFEFDSAVVPRQKAIQWLLCQFAAHGFRDEWLAAAVSYMDRTAAVLVSRHSPPESAVDADALAASPAGTSAGLSLPASSRISAESSKKVALIFESTELWLTAVQIALKMSEAEAELDSRIQDLILPLAGFGLGLKCDTQRWNQILKGELYIMNNLDFRMMVPAPFQLVERIALLMCSAAQKADEASNWPGLAVGHLPQLTGPTMRNLELQKKRQKLMLPKRPITHFQALAHYLIELLTIHSPADAYGDALPLDVAAIAVVQLAVHGFAGTAPRAFLDVLQNVQATLLPAERGAGRHHIISAIHRLWSHPPIGSAVVEKWLARAKDLGGQLPGAPAEFPSEMQVQGAFSTPQRRPPTTVPSLVTPEPPTTSSGIFARRRLDYSDNQPATVPGNHRKPSQSASAFAASLLQSSSSDDAAVALPCEAAADGYQSALADFTPGVQTSETHVGADQNDCPLQAPDLEQSSSSQDAAMAEAREMHSPAPSSLPSTALDTPSSSQEALSQEDALSQDCPEVEPAAEASPAAAAVAEPAAVAAAEQKEVAVNAASVLTVAATEAKSASSIEANADRKPGNGRARTVWGKTVVLSAALARGMQGLQSGTADAEKSEISCSAGDSGAADSQVNSGKEDSLAEYKKEKPTSENIRMPGTLQTCVAQPTQPHPPQPIQPRAAAAPLVSGIALVARQAVMATQSANFARTSPSRPKQPPAQLTQSETVPQVMRSSAPSSLTPAAAQAAQASLSLHLANHSSELPRLNAARLSCELPSATQQRLKEVSSASMSTGRLTSAGRGAKRKLAPVASCKKYSMRENRGGRRQPQQTELDLEFDAWASALEDISEAAELSDELR